MCGLAGVVGLRYSDTPTGLGPSLELMSGALSQRGPDGFGHWERPGVGFVHRRLSILDTTERASQPFATPDGRFVLVFNGVIYNYASLRLELQKLGYLFSSESDTEALLWGFVHYGPQILDRLSGMFAFAIWDTRDRILFLARDRLGEKPLYWYADEERFAFSSEVQALLKCSFVPSNPDLQGVHEFLSFQCVPGTRTAFADIQKLGAAHSMRVVQGAGGNMYVEEPKRYWKVPPVSPARHDRSADLAAEARSRLQSAVESRLCADVPVGAFLSGGIDSSMVVALMAQSLGPTFPCFTLGFESVSHDESQQALEFAKSLGLTCEVEVLGDLAPDLFCDIMARYGEPFADASAIPTYFLSRLASRDVKVVLTGDGGDEVFMGYPRYVTCKRIDVLKHIPRPVAGVLASFLDGLGVLSNSRATRWARLLRDRTLPPQQRYAYMVAYFTDLEKQSLYGDSLVGLLSHSAFDSLSEYFEGSDDLATAANRSDLQEYLPDDLLVKTDRATMSHGVEARAPFLEHSLVEWAMALPSEKKIVSQTPKFLLREAAAEILPQSVLDRSKRGFQCPMDVWLRGSLRTLLQDTLSSSQFQSRGLFNQPYVDKLVNNHLDGMRNNENALFALLNLELWFQRRID